MIKTLYLILIHYFSQRLNLQINPPYIIIIVTKRRTDIVIKKDSKINN